MNKSIPFFLSIRIVCYLLFPLSICNASYSQEKPSIDIDQAISRLPSATQNILAIVPKINDPLQYNYTGAKIIFDESFKDNRNKWSQDKEKDSINEQLVFFRPGTGLVLQLNNDTTVSANTIGMKSRFDFTKNFEYELNYDIRQTSPKTKVNISFCIAADSSHNGGLNLYIDDRGKLSIGMSQPKHAKKWKGTTFFVSRKIRNNKAKVCIRHLDGIYDIFYNSHYLGRLKDKYVLKGDELHIGNHLANTSITINAIRLYQL